ncbi:MAG: two-component system response regulator [Candidatus Eremiobacteraeota bacterium]|nr:two-component system response regulator [Candidatus Eremiobacteraeota bacterium]
MENNTILVIDDEEAVCNVLIRQLARAGLSNVITCSDPTKAVECFTETEPDLVILDINMPGMSGFEVLEALREQDAEQLVAVPIIVLTGEGGRDTRLHALEGGARDFLTKPCDPVELTARVKGYLEVRRLHSKLKQHNEELDALVRQRTREVEESKLEIIQRLMAAAEYRDDDTGNHILRMSQYCELVAIQMGLSESHCDRVLWASPMHDIGKIGIPDSILLKPGKLTNDEWELMKTHAAIGADLLSGSSSPVLQMAETIARTHHEKWNGQGYPKGLEGTAIPLEGRIVAIADVFDALVSERPYKKAWAVDDALEEIRRCSGSHFDPEVVDAFFRALPDILAIREAFADGVATKQLHR